MNPYGFYSLDDFLEFSPLSPNYANLNMVSSPRFRPPRIRSAFAIVPVPEDSSIAYHKEIYTVLFYPTSFVMVHSIVCHLWKKSKMEKQFLPLPPLRKSQQEPSIQPLSDSIPEAEGEITSSSTSVLESSTANDLYNFRFGCFHHSSNFDAARKLEEFVTNLVKIDPVDLDSTKSTANRSISKISFSCFEAYGIDAVSAVSAIRFFKQSLCINDFEKFVMEIDVLWIAKDASIASLMIECTVDVPVTSSRCVVTIFDPGGVIEPLSVTILPGAITVKFCLKTSFCMGIVLTVEFVNDFMITVFDPGGNHHRSPPLTTESTHSFRLNSSLLLNSFFLAMMLSLSYYSLKTSHFVFDPGGNQLISVLVIYYFDTLIRCLF